MIGWMAALRGTMTAAQWIGWWSRFQAWRGERNAKAAAEKAAKLGVLFIAAILSSGASCRNLATDIAEYCQERPWECGGPTPTPAPTATATPSPAPTAIETCPDGHSLFCQPSSGQCWCLPNMPTATPAITPTVAPAATVTPTPAPTPTAIPVPQCFEAAPPPTGPVSLAFRGTSCPRGFERLAYDITGPPGHVLCAVRSQCEHDGHAACFATGDKPAWRIAYDISAGHKKLLQYGDKWLAHDDGRGCADAYGRFFPDRHGCMVLYEHPEGPTAPWSFLGLAEPYKCPDATPTPAPTPTGPPSTSCAVVESTEHWMAPGQSCHQWEHDMGRIRCLVDSTIRPICDLDHQENWDGICGRRQHDPDYDSPEGAQAWIVSGAEDLGPHHKNSAQRWIIGEPGAEVGVTVCIRPDAVTPDGCRITRRGDGCGSRLFRLPNGLD